MSTLERSHGKVRVTRPRLSDVSVGAEPERRGERDARGRFASGNAIGRHRAAKRSLTATLRAAVDAAAGSLGGEAPSATEAAEAARQALTLYRAGRRELNTDSPITLSHVMRWAVNTTLAQRLEHAAGEAGIATDRGLRLLELAERLAGRAERASITAHALGNALRAAKREGGHHAPWLEGDEGDDKS